MDDPHPFCTGTEAPAPSPVGGAPKPVAAKPPPFYVSGQRDVELLSIPLLTRFDLRTIYKFGKHFGDLNRDTACCLNPGTATTTEQ